MNKRNNLVFWYLSASCLTFHNTFKILSYIQIPISLSEFRACSLKIDNSTVVTHLIFIKSRVLAMYHHLKINIETWPNYPAKQYRGHFVWLIALVVASSSIKLGMAWRKQELPVRKHTAPIWPCYRDWNMSKYVSKIIWICKEFPGWICKEFL